MPELPEVETTKNTLSKFIKKAKIIEVKIFRKDLRWPINFKIKSDIENSIILNPFRLGKYILIPTDKNKCLLLHLGMSGFLKISKTKMRAEKHDHVKFTCVNMKNEEIYIMFNDARRFGFVDCFDSKKLHEHFLIKKLGVEPFSLDLNVKYLLKKFHNKNVAIKSALLDQKIVAGIGNIYANEILFLSKIHPLLKVKFVDKKIANKLCKAIKLILKKAIEKGGTSIKDFKNPDGKIGYFKHDLSVYSREGKECFDCKKFIKMINLAGRSTYYCQQCQSAEKKLLKEI